MATYEAALAGARKVGVARCSDAEAMASFCDATIQFLVGAVSPKLVWQGAQAKGLSLQELVHLAASDVLAVSDLQWED